MLVELLKLLAPIELTGDAFGKVYEYFLGEFAKREGQKGGASAHPSPLSSSSWRSSSLAKVESLTQPAVRGTFSPIPLGSWRAIRRPLRSHFWGKCCWNPLLLWVIWLMAYPGAGDGKMACNATLGAMELAA